MRNKERTNLTPEQVEERKLARVAALDARIKRELEEAEGKKRKISVDYGLFVQICKFGFVVDNTELGRIDVPFTKADILSLCRGNLLEKDQMGKVYNFLMVNVTREQRIDVVKNSPLYWQLVHLV